MLAGATGALLILRRFALTTGLWLTVLGNQVTVTLLKHLFDRTRSTLGYFAETSGSFASGHAASSVAIWGMLFYLGWRTRLLGASLAGLAAITLAFLIGLSRIYLIEHYLSDVLNGYLVGALWLVLGIAFCEWRRDRAAGPADRADRAERREAIATAAMGLSVAVAVAFVMASVLSSPLNRAAAEPSPAVQDVGQLLAAGQIPQGTETLLGDPLEWAPESDAPRQADASTRMLFDERLSSLSRSGFSAMALASSQ